MFFGSFKHSIDSKGRLVIPSKMRDEAGYRIYIMRGYDGALCVYKEETFEAQSKKVSELPFNQKISRDFTRLALASVVELDVDKQGRIQIPTQVLNEYHISKDVLVVGVYDHFEIWDLDAWNKYVNENEGKFDENAEKLPVISK